MGDDPPPDTLNEIGVLTRREIEARILAPIIEAFAAECGRERVLQIAAQAIVRIAREQGRALADRMGGNSLAHFVRSQKDWTKNGALAMDVLRVTDVAYDFNVTRCRYAEMYRALGIAELGTVLSCGRDAVLGEGFNPDLKLARTQTIMDGAAHCDFRYRMAPSACAEDPSLPRAGGSVQEGANACDDGTSSG